MERKYKLMLVDDEPWALTGIEEIIDWEAEGFTVVARCGCGRDGILAAQIHQPDAVVTDIRMPDMSGLEMIRQIREIPVPAECVIVSAYSDFEVAREAIRLSAVHYLLKPLNERDVREAASLLRAKLDRTRRPVQKKAPVLLIDEKNPAFPSTRGEGAEPSFLILSDSPAVFSLQNTIKGYCQPIRFGTFAGILTTEKCTSLPPDTGESRPEPDFSDSWRLIRTAFASLDGGFRFAPEPEGGKAGKTPVSAADIQFYLWEHMGEDLGLKLLAGQFYLSETYICDLFKKQAGETVLGFLKRIRLHRAKRLLANSSLTLREIASRCGYTDYSYFGRHFKAETGLPPELYRKEKWTRS